MPCLKDSIPQIDPSVQELVEAVEKASTVTLMILAAWQLTRVLAVKIVEEVGSDCLGTLPDCGNFPEEILVEGLAKIMPYALNVHVKWTRRDAPGKRDVLSVVRMVQETGFDGTMFVEDGGPEDDHRGVLELKGALIAALNTTP